MSALDQILQWDQKVFIAIHDGLSNPSLDFIMPWLRNPFFWIPIYALLFYFVMRKFGLNGLLWVLALFVVFGIADFSSASILKKYFGRIRPCNEPALQDYIHAVVSCGSGKSFPSSHSSNHFGISFFIIFTLGPFFKWIKFPAIIWALLVVIAQVYVGVHYPLDILGGVVVGFIAAGIVSFLFNKYVPLKLIRHK